MLILIICFLKNNQSSSILPSAPVDNDPLGLSTTPPSEAKTYLTLQEENPAQSLSDVINKYKEGFIDDYGQTLTDAQYERFRNDTFGNNADLIPLEDFKNAHKESIDYFKGSIGAGGKEHGLFTQWYDNGAKRSEVNFKEGKKEGYEIYWEKNGDIKSKTLYEDGKPIK